MNIFFYFSLLLLASCTVLKPDSNDENIVYGSDEVDNTLQQQTIENGCYAKCLVAVIEAENRNILLPVYTGKDTQNDNIETVEIVTKAVSTKWVKKNADRNCKSADPNDCLVWCLTEVPEEREKIVTVKDTTLTKDFKFRYFNVQKYVKSENDNSNEWREILCENKITPQLYQDMSAKLKKLGYKVEEGTTEMTSTLKQALNKFQKDNDLPVYNLNLETLRALKLNNYIPKK